jgi:arabinan endo-1,5-alpha-L-arabinosidase
MTDTTICMPPRTYAICRFTVPGTAYEGTYIHKKDGHYYFFASIGSCCEGLKSTYTTVVGRSDNLFGPYVDKNGGSMMDNKHEVLIQKSNSFVGTGHNSEIVTDNAGNDWFFYHAVSTKKPEGRVLMLDKISWEDGWPTVEGSVASTEAVPATCCGVAPSFRESPSSDSSIA